ncbi:kinase-like domain-containing protein [Hypoxylon sp. FL1284]|nr:kinase-like domain-containing protein [Hypoxylon sp. FL1284]
MIMQENDTTLALNPTSPDTFTSGAESEDFESNDMTYEFTATTFKKTSRLPQTVTRLDGSKLEWFRAWNHERITNEVNALQLVSQKTTIPVPRLIDHGTHPDGRRYLITERINGFPLNDLLGMGCQMPEGQEHADEKPCTTCVHQSYSNALEFIQDTVLPQLASLKSQERGILGFVMPPSWLTDSHPPWKGKGPWKTHPLKEPKYQFQHGDLAAQNILVDPHTLHVKALIDWEYAGFFPPGMERWTGALDKETYVRRADDAADAIAEFLADEYLECYNQWKDKAALDLLVENGKLPRVEQLRLTRGKEALEYQ